MNHFLIPGHYNTNFSPPPLSPPDYRGHVSLECHEDCSIAYHLSCWRKYKTECEQKTDKEFLLTPCATPDCCGYVRMVVIYDTKGAVKAKVRELEEEGRKETVRVC